MPNPLQNSKRVVPVVVGTRPEAIKLVPIILALRDSDCYEPIIVSTGQHNRLVEYIFALAGIQPDVTLWAGSRRAALNERVASVMRRFEDFCVERFDIDPDRVPTQADVRSGRHPAMVLVHGDTSSAMAAAMSAFHLRIPVAHVEAGLRTGGNNLTPFPEELNRRVISTIAAMHFAPTSINLQNLVRESVPVSQIFVTGNTGIDALQWASQIDVSFSNKALQELFDSDRRIIVVTAHRRENWGDGLRGIAEGLARIADAYPDVSIVLPAHPNPRVRETLVERLGDLENVLLIDPLGYATFAKLLDRAHIVITDSGGVQEEAPALGKPVLVTRSTTERTEGLDAGTLRLVGSDPGRIAAEAKRLLDDPVVYATMASAANPYGDGLAAQRIVAALEHILRGGTPPTPFGPGYDRSAIALATGFEHDSDSLLNQLEADLADRGTFLPVTPSEEDDEGQDSIIAEIVDGAEGPLE
jgi:UDP-N-acetylglucosamine 2-epimerase (non-hydrolysing)